MPLPPDYKPRAGDQVTLSGIIRFDFEASPGSLYVDVEGGPTAANILKESILTIESYQIQAGDWVRRKEGLSNNKQDRPQEVIAIIDRYAWIYTAGGIPASVRTDALVRVNPPELNLEGFTKLTNPEPQA